MVSLSMDLFLTFCSTPQYLNGYGAAAQSKRLNYLIKLHIQSPYILPSDVGFPGD